MTMGGLFLLLEYKLVSKAIKTGILHTLHANGGQTSPPPAAPGYATAFSCENWHFAF